MRFVRICKLFVNTACGAAAGRAILRSLAIGAHVELSVCPLHLLTVQNAMFSRGCGTRWFVLPVVVLTARAALFSVAPPG